MARALTLDIPQRQVLVDFFGDANGLSWHHRVLCHGVGPGAWIALTPDLEVERINLNEHRVVGLPRAGQFPRARYAETYHFAADIGDQEWRTALAAARELAAVLGEPADGPQDVSSAWRVADVVTWVRRWRRLPALSRYLHA